MWLSELRCDIRVKYTTDFEDLVQKKNAKHLIKIFMLNTCYLMQCGDLNGKEIQKRGDICICIADSFCCTVETNATL